MKYVIDLDGTLCTITNGDYASAEPFQDRISHVNDLWFSGHDIIIHTARGMSTNTSNKYAALTEHQLKLWGLHYDHLVFGKPSGDFYIDDKGMNADEFFKP